MNSTTLMDSLWGKTQPRDPRGALRSSIYGLRKSLGIQRILKTHSSGYALELADDDVVDIHTFRALRDEARRVRQYGDTETAITLLRRALDVWDDPPLVDVPSADALEPLVFELIEERNTVQEDLVDAQLSLGQHHALIPPLTALTLAEPLRERRWEQLMLALYRCGRRAEALEAYTRARTLFVERHGLEPGPSLRRLQQQILTSDFAAGGRPARTAGPETAAPDRTAPTIESRSASARATAVGRPLVTPGPLPVAPRHFAGRHLEFATLLNSPSARPAGIAVISGAPGVGKTALALHVAHSVADQFPDGQFYVDLRGFGPSGQPVEPGQVASIVPGTPTGSWLTWAPGGRTLIVIDNALSSAQVRPLLPASPECMVLVTSRRKLTDLVDSEGATLLTLDALPEADAQNLLTNRLVSHGVPTTPQIVAWLSKPCGGLPLALEAAAARAGADPLSTPLNDDERGLDALDALGGPNPRTDIRAVFSWSYDRLTAPAARTFRILGTYAGEDITAATIADLANIPHGQAAETLDELSVENLVIDVRPGWYRMHPLLRAYAAEKSAAFLSDLRDYQVTGSS